MKKINIANYELYFLDYLDGNLNDIQIAELKAFVILNPHLQDEFDSLDNNLNVNEVTEKINLSTDFKQDLKKNVPLISDSLSTDETLICDALDGKIDIKLLSPQLQKQVNDLKNIKLEQDLSINFENRNSLKQIFISADLNETFSNKDNLKKEEKIVSFINDDLIIAYISEELDQNDKINFEKELKSNKKLQNQTALFKHTFLTSDFQVVFPNKENLKREKSKIIPLFYKISSVAAILVLGITIGSKYLINESGLSITKPNNTLAYVTTTKNTDNNIATKSQKIINNNALLQKIYKNLGSGKVQNPNNSNKLIPVEYKSKPNEVDNTNQRIASNKTINIKSSISKIDSANANTIDTEKLMAYNNTTIVEPEIKLTTIKNNTIESEEFNITTVKADDLLKAKQREDQQYQFSSKNIIKRIYKTITNDTLNINNKGKNKVDIDAKLFAFSN